MYYLRPAIRLTEDATSGLVYAFTGIDPAQPLYCLNGGLKATLNFWHLFGMLIWGNSIYSSSEIIINMLDLGLSLMQNCNLISTLGGVASVGTMLYMDNIVSWAQANSQESLVYYGLFAYSSVQVLNDAILATYAAYLWINHFDLRNLAYVAVKAVNTAMMAWSTSYIHGELF
ncbi:hypothetical protein FGO68_gene12383 [Halteria grandinella]|uniref:Uncharacterized protein n=1 Tax=Halteria grandinella TaxID=5974 RepID=A0A8J8NVP7_HALGN|nr:hypothetical protein FGO68_gene12383 [Halteria grandinella]